RVPLGSEHHLVLPRPWAAQRPPARGRRSPGACSGGTCRVPPPYSEPCSTVKNTVHTTAPGDQPDMPQVEVAHVRHQAGEPSEARVELDRLFPLATPRPPVRGAG